MESVTFYSYKPFLYIAIHRERGLSVQFDDKGVYRTSNRVIIQLLREYAENTKASYLIAEAGGELEQADLARENQAREDKLIAEAEKGKKKRKSRR